eukprot:g2069.t1
MHTNHIAAEAVLGATGDRGASPKPKTMNAEEYSGAFMKTTKPKAKSTKASTSMKKFPPVVLSDGGPPVVVTDDSKDVKFAPGKRAITLTEFGDDGNNSDGSTPKSKRSRQSTPTNKLELNAPELDEEKEETTKFNLQAAKAAFKMKAKRGAKK